MRCESAAAGGRIALTSDRVVEQPFKIPFVAAILQVANADNAEVGKAIVEIVAGQLQKYLDQGMFTQLKLVVRLLACMGSMLDGKGVYEVLDPLKERADQAKADNDIVRVHDAVKTDANNTSRWRSRSPTLFLLLCHTA